ncbi:MAG: hypothetical protein KF727_03450 [Microbacteriaceae bacterium]|nr:hypothetical protein [Microbacteriaceae bacterium]
MDPALYSIVKQVMKLPQTVGNVVLTKDLRTTMADGTALPSDHLTPDGDTDAPLILVRTARSAG